MSQKIEISAEAMLFKRRWELECETALLLAIENGKLRQINAEQKALLDKQQTVLNAVEIKKED